MASLGLSSVIWRRMHEQYNTVLTAKAEKIKDSKKRNDFLSLDRWYQEELPGTIASRKEKHINKEELVKLMKWKLARGKFRPKLQQMVAENSEDDVETASKKAFKALPNLQSALGFLCVLKAVGPATASAILAAGAPEHAPFMADECMMAVPGLQPIKYTVPAYLEYAKEVAMIEQHLQEQELAFTWTPHLVELTLWTYEIARALDLKEVLALANYETVDTAAPTKSKPSKTKKSHKPGETSNKTASKRKPANSDQPSKGKLARSAPSNSKRQKTSCIKVSKKETNC